MVRSSLLVFLVLSNGCALSFDRFEPGGADAGLLCPPGFWESAPRTETTAQVCERLTECSPSEYASVAPTSTSDRVCAPLTVCPTGSYAIVPHTPTSDRECSFLSCLDLLTREPETPSGAYVIDPDGEEGVAAFEATCDMELDGGGWTVISLEDFGAGADGWSDPRTSTCGAATVLGGPVGFGLGALSERGYDLRGLAHTQARLALRYYRFDSWDGELAIVRVDGADVFAMGSTGFACATSEPSQAFQVDATVGHSAGTLTVTVTSTLDEAGDNESFGIDDLELRIR